MDLLYSCCRSPAVCRAHGTMAALEESDLWTISAIRVSPKACPINITGGALRGQLGEACKHAAAALVMARKGPRGACSQSASGAPGRASWRPARTVRRQRSRRQACRGPRRGGYCAADPSRGRQGESCVVGLAAGPSDVAIVAASAGLCSCSFSRRIRQMQHSFGRCMACHADARMPMRMFQPS